MGRLEERRKMTEYEIQKLRDMALSLDPEEAYIVYSELEQKKADQEDAIRAMICDKYCKYPNQCKDQDELDSICEKYEGIQMLDKILGIMNGGIHRNGKE